MRDGPERSPANPQGEGRALGSFREFLKTHAVGRWLLIPYRFRLAFPYHLRSLMRVIPWLWRSREVTDVSYDITDLNSRYLAELLAVVTGSSVAEIRRYQKELEADAELREHVRKHTLNSNYSSIADADERLGKRLVWYALVRATKPRIVIEAGVNRGFGTCVIAAALRRNSTEGHDGHVYGVDLEPTKGYLLSAPYTSYGEIVVSDIRAFLGAFEEEVDLFIHDTQNVPGLERDEYRLAEPRLARDAMVCSVWASEELLELAGRTGRRCLGFSLESKDHWYPGARIAIAFPQESELPRSTDFEERRSAGRN